MSPDPSTYLVLIEGDGSTNYSAWSPDLPGCVAAGDTKAQTIALMREAIELHLAGMLEDGDPIPRPTGPGVYVEYDAGRPSQEHQAR